MSKERNEHYNFCILAFLYALVMVVIRIISILLLDYLVMFLSSYNAITIRLYSVLRTRSKIKDAYLSLICVSYVGSREQWGDLGEEPIFTLPNPHQSLTYQVCNRFFDRLQKIQNLNNVNKPCKSMYQTGVATSTK